MDTFTEFLHQIADPAQRARTQQVLATVAQRFPQLDTRIAWGQPTFTHHGTFIISFSLARQHLAVAPELAAIQHFEEELKQNNYPATTMLFRIPWNREIDWDLLTRMIQYNIDDKKNCQTYWRKPAHKS